MMHLKSFALSLTAAAALALALPVMAAVRPALIIKDTPALHQSSSLTVDGWFYLKAEQATPYSRLVSKYGHVSNDLRGWELCMEKEKLAFRVHVRFAQGGDQDYQVVSAHPVPVEQWVHLAGVFADEGNGLRRMFIYINGRQEGSLKLPDNCEMAANTAVDIYPGVYAGSFASQALVYIDDLRISGRAIQFLEAPARPADPAAPGTLALFSFDGEVMAAPGIAAGIVGEEQFVPGKFGNGMDLSGDIDLELFQKAQTVGRAIRVADRVEGDFRLMIYTSQTEARLQLRRKDGTSPMHLQLAVTCDATGEEVHRSQVLLDDSAEVVVPLGGLEDGNYTARLADADGKMPGDLVRRLRLQHPLHLQPPAEPIRFDSDTLIFPVDDFHFARRDGVVNKVCPPEVTMTTPPVGNGLGWQRSCNTGWFSVTPEGLLQQNFTASPTWECNRPQPFHAISADGGATWSIAPGAASTAGSQAHIAFKRPAAATPHWQDKAPFDDSNVRFYTPEDGPVPLSEIRVACIAPHIGNAASRGLLSWGSYPVWERTKGEWIILTKEPLCVAKFGYTETELESPLDANDNFGGQFLSDDGKTLYYYQAAKLHCFPPRAVPYDNIADSFRQMRVFYTSDGFHWKQRFIATPDELDHPTLQHYGHSILRITPDFSVGLLAAYNVESQQICSELIYSRDNIQWQRLQDRTPFFPNTSAPGSTFFGMLFTDISNTPVYEYRDDFYIALGSQWHQRPHFYFCYAEPSDSPEAYNAAALKRIYGSRHLQDRWPYFDAVGGWEGLARDYRRFHDGTGSTVGFGKLRKNRWIAVACAQDSATLTSRLWSAPGKALYLNGEGDVTVELQDADGRPLPGYSGANAAHFNGDAVDAPLSFGSGTALPAVPFRAVIRMRGAKIYTINMR